MAPTDTPTASPAHLSAPSRLAQACACALGTDRPPAARREVRVSRQGLPRGAALPDTLGPGAASACGLGTPSEIGAPGR